MKFSCMKTLIILLFTFFLAHYAIAQKQFTQTVRGTVTSTDPESNIFSASVLVLGSDPLIGTITDENNEFSLNVPTGRQVIEIRCLGFETKQLNVLVTSDEKRSSCCFNPSSVN